MAVFQCGRGANGYWAAQFLVSLAYATGDSLGEISRCEAGPYIRIAAGHNCCHQSIVRQVGVIGSRCHAKAGEHRQASLRHLGQMKTFAAYQMCVVFSNLVKSQSKWLVHP